LLLGDSACNRNNIDLAINCYTVAKDTRKRLNDQVGLAEVSSPRRSVFHRRKSLDTIRQAHDRLGTLYLRVGDTEHSKVEISFHRCRGFIDAVDFFAGGIRCSESDSKGMCCAI
jgi:hypothetical protein